MSLKFFRINQFGSFESTHSSRVAVLVVMAGIATGCSGVLSTGGASFPVVETTIAEIHLAMENGTLTARQLVESYLDRIEAYDKHAPALNAIITVNPQVRRQADELDRAFAQRGLTGPLHGIPVIVKDNYDTVGLATSAGSLALADSMPPDDAFQVRRLREAGGLVLAKANMAEFAFSPYETVGSRLPGYTRNPYALNRVTAGSSGGTAAAIAASFGVVGLGTDTGNSIRGPAAHQALVGIRSTMGFTSRDGIVPLNLDRDIGGPLARTVTDAVTLFDVIAGPDIADPVTLASQGRLGRPLAAALRTDSIAGSRLGVLREMSGETADPAVVGRFDEAITDLSRLGAVVVDPVALPEVVSTEVLASQDRCRRFRFDLNAYLASLGPAAPYQTLKAIVVSGRFHPSVRERLVSSLTEEESPEMQLGCATQAARDERLRSQVRAVLAAHDLDALIYPSWDNPPRLIGDLNTPHGNNNQRLAPPTGFPALTVPMGYVHGMLPVGLQLLGNAWSEFTLVGIAYAYEQATQHRMAPPTTPMLD